MGNVTSLQTQGVMNMKAFAIGTLVDRKNRYYWRHKDLSTGKYTMMLIVDESGRKIEDKRQARRRMQELAADEQRIKSLQTKADYIQRVAEVNSIIKTCKVKFEDLPQAYIDHPARTEGQMENKLSAITDLKKWVQHYYPEMDKLSHLSNELAGEYLTKYRQSGVSAKSYNSRLQCLRMIFRVFVKEENPFDGYPYKSEEVRGREAFTKEQLNRIWATLNSDYHLLHKEEMRVLYFLALYTGARCGDLCLLKWECVKMDSRVLCISPGKTKFSSGKQVMLPIAVPLHHALTMALKWRMNDYVLPKVADRYQHNPWGISSDTTKLLEASGVSTKRNDNGKHRKNRSTRFGFHSFRHTNASMLINGGVNPMVVRDMLGHTTESMTARYSHISLETMEQAVKCLPHPVTPLETQNDFKTRLESASPKQWEKLIFWLDANLAKDHKISMMDFLNL